MDLARAMESASSGWAKGLTRFAEQGRGRIGRAHVAQLVEHVLGKDEVSSSILLVGSIPRALWRVVVRDRVCRGKDLDKPIKVKARR